MGASVCSPLPVDTFQPSPPGSWRTAPTIRPSCCTVDKKKNQSCDSWRGTRIDSVHPDEEGMLVRQQLLINFHSLIQNIKQLTLVNGPAKRHKPPNPQLCKKCNGCWEASSVASMFCIILWTDASTIWSLDTLSTLFTFWSSREWLWKTETVESTSYWSQFQTPHIHDREHLGKYDRSLG